MKKTDDPFPPAGFLFFVGRTWDKGGTALDNEKRSPKKPHKGALREKSLKKEKEKTAGKGSPRAKERSCNRHSVDR